MRFDLDLYASSQIFVWHTTVVSLCEAISSSWVVRYDVSLESQCASQYQCLTALRRLWLCMARFTLSNIMKGCLDTLPDASQHSPYEPDH